MHNLQILKQARLLTMFSDWRHKIVLKFREVIDISRLGRGLNHCLLQRYSPLASTAYLKKKLFEKLIDY